jgi:predicted  nucleic acid-binding Zn-ribbon protein
LQVVGPKREKLAEAMVALSGVQRALAAKQAELAEVEGQLAALGQSLDTAKAKKEQLQVRV